MTPLVVIAFLIGFAAAFLWQRTRVAGARLQAAIARSETRSWAREATEAWQVIAYLEDENSQFKDENVRLRKESADQWDDGYLYAANIDAKGEVDR